MADHEVVEVRHLVELFQPAVGFVSGSGSMTHAMAEDVASTGEVGGTRIDLTVAFTDLEGFTAFTAAEGDDAAGRVLLAHHRQADRLARDAAGESSSASATGCSSRSRRRQPPCSRASSCERRRRCGCEPACTGAPST